MGRRIVTSEPQGLQGESLDSFSGRVVKYIPADVVAAWVTISSIIAPKVAGAQPEATTASAAGPDYVVLWVVFGVFVILTALWTWRTTSKPGLPIAKTQIAISTVSFIIWVFGLGGPFLSIAFVRERAFLGGVALIIWTLVAGLLVPPEPSAPKP